MSSRTNTLFVAAFAASGAASAQPELTARNEPHEGLSFRPRFVDGELASAAPVVVRYLLPP